MEELVSPKFQMHLINSILLAFSKEYNDLKDIQYYLEKFQTSYRTRRGRLMKNFQILKTNSELDIRETLNRITAVDLLRIAIDLGIETPNFIPCVPIFRNELKVNFQSAHNAFEKAFKDVVEKPDIAIGLANSALESIIKEILKEDKFASDSGSKKTLYPLAQEIVKRFYKNDTEYPEEAKKIGTSLLAICQSIEDLRSTKTNFHGTHTGAYIVSDSLYAYFIVNSVATVGLFLLSYYKTKYPKTEPDTLTPNEPSDEIPF